MSSGRGAWILVRVVGACCVAAAPALGSTFSPGDLFIGRGSTIDWRDPQGNLIMNINTGPRTAGMRHHPATGELWMTTFFFGTVKVIRSDGSLGPTYSTPGLPTPESVVFDSTGNAFIGGPDAFVDGGNVVGRVIKLDAGGNPLDAWNVAREDRGSDWIDLCDDDHTLLYTSEGVRILRYDVGTGQQLADFADLSGYQNPSGQQTRLFAVRGLPDGNVLAAGSNDLYLFDPAGNVIRNFITPNLDAFFSLALTPSGTEFWTAGSGPGANVYKFDIASGQLVDQFSLGAIGSADGIAVFGDTVRWNCVPEPGVLLALLCAGPSVLLLRFRRCGS
jgi:hypothetical protein